MMKYPGLVGVALSSFSLTEAAFLSRRIHVSLFFYFILFFL